MICRSRFARWGSAAWILTLAQRLAAAPILTVAADGVDVLLTWQGVADRVYVVERLDAPLVVPPVSVGFAGTTYLLRPAPPWEVVRIEPGVAGTAAYRDVGALAPGAGRMVCYRATESTPAPDDDMVPVPGGRFVMGDTWERLPATDEPGHEVFVGPFWIDAKEVTNARYAVWLNEAHALGDLDVVSDGEVRNTLGLLLCEVQPLESRSHIVYDAGAAPPFAVESGGYGDHPVVFVTSWGAAAFAAHYGMRLPTEAEWEKAARGGLVGHHYPWPSELSDYNACISSSDANYYILGQPHGTTPVASYAPNGYGLYDVAGNVGEWCHDWYSTSANYYTMYAPDQWPRNPRGPAYTGRHAVRGGDYNQFPSQVRCCSRQSAGEFDLGPSIGFRCVFSSAW